MSLPYPPKPGEILMCSFPPVAASHVLKGEMVKTRPVIVVSRDLRSRRHAVTVVPISMTHPQQVERYHIEVDAGCFPKLLQQKPGIRWAVCDQVCTISRDRLDRVQTGYRDGRKMFWTGKVHMETLRDIRRAIAYVLRIDQELLDGQDPATVATEAVAAVIAKASTIDASH